MKAQLAYLMLFLFCGSCFPPDYLLKTPEPLYESGVPDSVFKTKLRTDGIYETSYQSQVYNYGMSTESLLFINNKLADLQLDHTQGIDDTKLEYYTSRLDLFDPNYKGTFYIKDDTIYYKQVLKYFARGSVLKFYTTHFRGIIKNKDTIVDMHMVPPYPTVWPELNSNFINEKLPKTFYFKEDKELAKLDSLLKASKIIR